MKISSSIHYREFSTIKVRRVWTIFLFLHSTVQKCQSRTRPCFPKSHLQLVKNVHLLNISWFDLTSSNCFLACAQGNKLSNVLLFKECVCTDAVEILLASCSQTGQSAKMQRSVLSDKNEH